MSEENRDITRIFDDELPSTSAAARAALQALQARCSEAAVASPMSSDLTFETANFTETPTKTFDKPFVYKLIDYIIESNRILFVDKAEIWQDFYKSDDNYNEATTTTTTIDGERQTPAELAEYFCELILPNISEYKLTHEQQRITELLNLHPEYVRTNGGYKRVPHNERVANSRAPQAQVDYHELNDNNDVDMTDLLTPGKRKLDKNYADHSVENMNLPIFQFKKPYKLPHQIYGYRLSQENSALLSAELSADYELSAYTLFKPQELHKRLRLAKQQFEDHASMPENCNTVDQLVEKLTDIRDMRKALVDVVEKQFQFHADCHDCAATHNDNDDV